LSTPPFITMTVETILSEALGEWKADTDEAMWDYVIDMISTAETVDDNTVDELEDFLRQLLPESATVDAEKWSSDVIHALVDASILSSSKEEYQPRKLEQSTRILAPTSSAAKVAGDGLDNGTMTALSTEMSTTALSNKEKRKDRKREGNSGSHSSGGGKSGGNHGGSNTTPLRVIHRERADVRGSRDIHVDQLSVIVGSSVLLHETMLLLVYGHRYGLIGRNGVGKTSLLRQLVSGSLAFPKNIQVLYVEQEAAPSSLSPLQAVLETDYERTVLLEEEGHLLGKNTPLTAVEEARLPLIHERLIEIDAFSAEARAGSILQGLGFANDAMKSGMISQLSGGWRMRIAIAQALFCEPDVLLLDEPTNHLDIPAVVWLQAYLQSCGKTLLIVSHDRDFLDSVCTDIVEMKHQKLTTYKGDYSQYEKTRAEKEKQQASSFKRQQKQKEHLQAFIDRWRYSAARASSAQSRIKVLQKMVDVPPLIDDEEITFQFPEVDNLSGVLLQLQDVSLAWPSSPPLFRNVQMSVFSDSRIGIVGPNGIGKSTLLQCLMGELQPLEGYRFCSSKIRVGVYSQHFTETLDLNTTALAVTMRSFPGKSPQDCRALLGRFGITGEAPLRALATLSGGQKARVVFAIMAGREPHVMLLDEPTNHLDLDSVEALGCCLNAYRGGLVLVTHSERLLTMVTDELWVCRPNGTVLCYEGGYSKYKKELLSTFNIQGQVR
jgi:ATP-binding cassette, subfamily F, member 3